MAVLLVSDQELVHEYILGKEAPLATLLQRHQTKVYSTIYYLVKDEALAQDIFQDTWIKVINTLKSGRYNEEGKFLPWVTRIAHNLVIDHFRRNKRIDMVDGTSEDEDGEHLIDRLGHCDESHEDLLMKQQSVADLQKMILLLPEEQKEVLLMRHYGDMSFKEISDITGVSINTALGRMRYALNNLRRMIQEKELELVY